MAYATLADVQSRITRTLSAAEEAVCPSLLDDAAVIIDATGSTASDDAKKTVSCRMIVRALGDGSVGGVPIGSSQGSMGGLGYTSSWTMGSGGSVGQLYLDKTDKRILGIGNWVGSYSPVEELVCSED